MSPILSPLWSCVIGQQQPASFYVLRPESQRQRTTKGVSVWAAVWQQLSLSEEKAGLEISMEGKYQILFSFHPISEFVLEQKFQGKHTKTQSLFTIFLSILGSTYFFPFSMLILTRRLGENKVTTNLKRSSENINPSTNPKKGESKYFPP